MHPDTIHAITFGLCKLLTTAREASRAAAQCLSVSARDAFRADARRAREMADLVLYDAYGKTNASKEEIQLFAEGKASYSLGGGLIVAGGKLYAPKEEAAPSAEGKVPYAPDQKVPSGGDFIAVENSGAPGKPWERRTLAEDWKDLSELLKAMARNNPDGWVVGLDGKGRKQSEVLLHAAEVVQRCIEKHFELTHVKGKLEDIERKERK